MSLKGHDFRSTKKIRKSFHTKTKANKNEMKKVLCYKKTTSKLMTVFE